MHRNMGYRRENISSHNSSRNFCFNTLSFPSLNVFISEFEDIKCHHFVYQCMAVLQNKIAKKPANAQNMG